MAAQIASQFIENETIAFIFMTDGGAKFPATGIKALKEIQQKHPKKLHYAGI